MADGGIRTIEAPVRIAFEERKSRFISHLAPVTSVDDATDVIASLQAEFEDATHVVSAYRIHGDPPQEQADDAGEPGGSAGDPALGVLRSADIVDIVAIVIRYYGGTKLGYGGLVRAYARAVSDALDRADVITRHPIDTMRIEVDYDDSGTVQSVLESEDVDVDATYGEQVVYTVAIPSDRLDAVLDRLRSSTNGRVNPRG